MTPHLRACGVCTAEEDHDQRAWEDMCILDAPVAAEPAAPGELRTRVARRIFSGYRVYLEGRHREQWAVVTPSANTRRSADETAANIEFDIECMPIRLLIQRYCA